jgi:hypothetical protein
MAKLVTFDRRSMLNVIRWRLQALLTAERARAARTTGEPQSFFGRGRGVTARALREARVELTRLRVLDLALRQDFDPLQTLQ